MAPCTAIMFSTNLLFASLFWGSVGVGFTVYGKRQGAPAAWIGGVAMVVCSYFIGSALFLTLVSMGIAAVSIWLTKEGF
jgi:hypothetical protein